jgi:competence protein ComGC
MLKSGFNLLLFLIVFAKICYYYLVSVPKNQKKKEKITEA